MIIFNNLNLFSHEKPGKDSVIEYIYFCTPFVIIRAELNQNYNCHGDNDI